MKIRHISLVLAAVLAIAFMQPLVSFLGGLTLLLGVGALIFRELPPAGQDAVERRVLGWLRRVRAGPAPESGLTAFARRQPPADPDPPALSVERVRRGRAKAMAPPAGGDGKSPPA